MIAAKYLLDLFLRMFFLFLICFFGLYIIIDFANQSSSLSQHLHLHWYSIVNYYLFVFSNRAEILIPLSLLIATIYSLTSLNSNHELAAFMAGGYSLHKLLSPIIFFGFFCVIALYANEQYLMPAALKHLQKIDYATKHKKNRYETKLTAKHIRLDNHSLLVFQNFDPSTETFFDAYWIESINSIYRIKILKAGESIPYGEFVDHLERKENGEVLQKEAFDHLEFPKIIFHSDILQSSLIDPEIQSLTKLAKKMKEISPVPDEKESKILTAFYWKLALPWLCLLAVMIPSPFCVRFSRNIPIFMITVCSLFGLIAFYMFLDAGQVVAKRQVLPPFWAIIIPFFSVFSYFSWRYYKLERT